MFVLAKYIRLSSEDNDLSENGKQESNSIVNQRNLLDAYIHNHIEFNDAEVIEFCDDGWSGKTFERPGVQKMLEQVRLNAIDCIIVKDLSRFGRDYLEVGNYISRVFPFMGVRFIAVNDGFDSIRPLEADSLETSFKTLLYDLYSRDLSRKVRSAKRFRAERGDFMSAFAPYGYIKDPKNHSRLVIDPEAAAVVRRIFLMAGEGYTAVQIAKKLNQDNVLTRMCYKRAAGCSRSAWPSVHENNFWIDETVIRILRDERYLGKSVYGKRICDRVGQSHTVKAERSEWVVVEATHEGIVTKEEFDRAAANLRKWKEREGTFHDWPLGGKVRCGVCGHVMQRSRKAEYYCRTPTLTDVYSCPSEKIEEQAILDVLLENLHKQALIEVDAKRVWEERRSVEREDTACIVNQISSLKEVLSKQEQHIKSMYEAFALGEIGKREYLAAKAEASDQKAATCEALKELSGKLEAAKQRGNLDKCFVSHFQKYAEVTEITSEIVSDVLNSVLIFPGGRMEIHWNYREEKQQSILDANGVELGKVTQGF